MARVFELGFRSIAGKASGSVIDSGTAEAKVAGSNKGNIKDSVVIEAGTAVWVTGFFCVDFS